ncbi:unnamed protein product [Clonostachys solani]|uniref:Heterokaryon incompatibility domain-containing protein n=1 Tax=Clonostachys solani TaxID=160281 RepID=A0A9N9W2W1_9HYPO|nr:unnamed protein product [Clonostachys solani]
MDQAGNVLCQKCQGVQIDDTVLSDHIRTLPDGSKYSDKTWSAGEILVPIASWTDYPPEFPKLQESHIKTGCKFCKYLREALLLSGVEFLESPIHIHLSHNWFNDGRFREIQEGNYSGIVGHIEDGEATYGMYFRAGSDDFRISQWLGIHGTPKPVVLCKENILWAASLLDNPDHTSALQDRDDGFLPTRLLDIGETGTPNPRLVSTSKETGPVSYCALSYCWGELNEALPQLTTKKSTFQQYSLQGIPSQQLTKVFKDAIDVCHSFGIRYLWIDALCITQDDPSDWERETTMMHQVYRNSYFTICALSSNSTHSSFLERNQHMLDMNFLSSLDSEISGKLTLDFQRINTGGEVMPSHYRSDIFTDAEWSSRGWTFQEDQMSQRALYFTNSQLVFRARDQYFAEDGWSFPGFRFNLRTVPTLENWYGQMMSFRRRKFSNVGDVLPSLSGIVRGSIKYHGDTYVAGHWKSDLLRGLLWQSSTYRLEEGREALLRNLSFPPLYIAPSWSYLSRTEYGAHGMNLHQVGREGHFRSRAEFADAWTIPAGQDPYGKILAGTARIRGRIIPCPSDFSKIHDGIFEYAELFQLHVDGAYTATCQLDWRVNDDWESSHDLSLLLLASTCHRREDGRPTTHYLEELGNKSDSGSSESTHGEHNGNEQETLADEELPVSLALLDIQETAASETENEEEGMSFCCEGCNGSSLQILSDENGIDSDVPPSKTLHELCHVCGHCMECCKSEVNNHAWGLIIHPALESGQYFRVGVFTSRSDGSGTICGTRLFNEADYQEIDII